MTTEQSTTMPLSSSFLGKDFLASVVVFLVALPLCLGIAIASGVPPALGLIAGIVGGLLVGFFSGAPLQVSGPAAGLVSIVWEIVSRHGIEALGVIVFLAGFIQLAAGYFRLSPMFRAVSPAVVQGMLAAIGIMILSSQFHVMVDDAPQASAILNLLTIPESFIKGLLHSDNTSHHLAYRIGLLTLVILTAWSFLPKKVQAVPAALVAVGASVAVAAWLAVAHPLCSVAYQFFVVGPLAFFVSSGTVRE